MGKKIRVCKNYDALEKIKRLSKQKPSDKFNKAVNYFKSREEIIYERMLDYEKNGDKCIISKEEVIKILKGDK